MQEWAPRVELDRAHGMVGDPAEVGAEVSDSPAVVMAGTIATTT